MKGTAITPFDWETEDWSQFAIVDRVGLSVERVPNSFWSGYSAYLSGGGTSGIARYWRELNSGTTDGVG